MGRILEDLNSRGEAFLATKTPIGGDITDAAQTVEESFKRLRTYPLDFVQVDYSIANRNAAAEVLPLAAERKIGVLVNMPFGGRREGNLLRKLGSRQLPPWADELDAKSWAEVLLKYVLSQPAVTCVIPGTTSVANLETNLRAAHGLLPDATLRRRMEDHWDTIEL